nr:EOG090X02I4 [Eurycercus lamellatus]
MRCFVFVVGIFLVIQLALSTGNRLNEYILHYETLDYDVDAVAAQHNRNRRSLEADGDSPSSFVHLEFHSHGKPFRLKFKRDTSTFSPNVEIVSHQGHPIDVDTSHLYEGHLQDEPKSFAFGSITDGVFDGKIHSQDGVFYVEKAAKYFPLSNNSSNSEEVKFHSIIYKESHVIDPYEEHRTGHVGGCGVTDEVAAWMDDIQHGAEDETGRSEEEAYGDAGNEIDSNLPHSKNRQSINGSPSSSGSSWYKYSHQANVGEEQQQQETPPTANRRQKRTTKPNVSRTTCSLFIQTDPLLWKHFYELEKRNADNTRKEITSLIAQHVKAVNAIYMETRFDGKFQHRMTRFEVQRIKIDDYEACEQNYIGEENKFCLPNIDVSNFLNLHSQGNHEDFCLAYVFTYRDFTGGTLGLAWVASPSGASGGICERYKTYTENMAGYPRTTKRSLNTGIITFVNYNSRVPPKVSQLTLAHEIGHNFGSPHDYPSHCRPGGQNGNYIMFASATSGERPNNSRFSNCSVGNISSVLDAIEDGKKKNCFTDWKGAFCGNKIVEDGEECDCGYADDECEEKCCYPRVVSDFDKANDPSAQGCKRRPGKQCSPSQGQCCDRTCNFVSASAYQQCKEEGECNGKAFCNGHMAKCPPPPNNPDGTECNGNTQVCQNGECSGSICSKFGMKECFLTSNLIDDKRKLCELACQMGNDNTTCKGTSELHSITKLPTGISLRPGSPCDNYQGYCDVFLKCRAVDAEGPLARLKNLLFNRETLLTIAQWITEYWWAVLLMGVAFVLFMGVFIKCCAVHTPSSNPKKPPALSITQTLRHPYSTLRRKRHHNPQQQPAPSAPYIAAPNPAGGPPPTHGETRNPYSRPKGGPASGWGHRAESSPYAYSGGQGGRTSAYEMNVRQHRV